MASRLNNCSESEIETINNSNSDFNAEQESHDCITITKLQRKRNSNIKNLAENVSDISSDTENVFQNVRYALPKNNNSNKETVSIKIKFRRSTEQSLYKIDTDFEYEIPKRKSHRLQRQKQKTYSELDNEETYTDGTENFTNIKISNDKKLPQKQTENEDLRGNRTRRPPLRLSSYHCDTLSSLNSTKSKKIPQISSENSPSLRSRKNINYNEDKLLINSIITNMKNEKKLSKPRENKISNSSIDKDNLKLTKNNKRNHIFSTEDEENDRDTDCKIIKVKSLKQSNKPESSINDKMDHAPKIQQVLEIQNSLTSVSINNTPDKSIKQKRMISEGMEKDIEYIDNNSSNNKEESLTDMYKRIKISSATKNSTTLKMNKQKRIVPEIIQTKVQLDDKNNSGEEDEYLSDVYMTKMSSAKKKILTPQKRNNLQKSIELQLSETHLSTPKSRSMKYDNLTPSLGKRKSALLKPATPLQVARSRLHVSAVPKSLPCREEEFNNIFTFLRGKLEDKSGGCIYISGVPGTGKTATVNEAVRCLQKLIIKGQLDNFDYVAINGMKLTEPRQAYVQILKQLDGKTATWEQSYHMLEKRFRNATSKMTLLLVDELDFLCTKRQDVVYNLLDWPTKPTAQLVVITIANTMDLPERVLMGRVTSRLGLTRLTFQPYNYKQLQEIVMSRLKDFNGFRNEAIQLVARKVSAVSGDARRALDICRRAIEIAESRTAETISLQDVTDAVSEMIASPKVQAIKRCSKMEQIFLQAISAEVTRTSIEEIYFKDAYIQLESLCSFNGIELPTVTEVLAVCGRLGASGLLICEHSRNDIYQKILLNVSTDDIHYAIQELDLNEK